MDRTGDAERLRRIESILAATPPASEADASDQAARHLASIPFDRIRLLTKYLQDDHDPAVDSDEIDAVAMRVLLNEYTAAVRRLREVVRYTESRIDTTIKPIAAARRFLSEQAKIRDRGGYAQDDAEPVTREDRPAAPLD